MIVTKTPEMLDDIMKPNIIRNEFELENTHNWIWNADPKTPSMLYKQHETYYFFNWSTGERHPLPTSFKRGILYKELIVEIYEMSARVLRSDTELHKYDFKDRIEAVCMNEKLIIFATKDYTVHIIDMNTDQRTSLQLPHLTPHEKRVRERLGGSPRGSLRPSLYLYEDLLVGRLDCMLFFYDLNRAKELTRISFQSSWPVSHFFRASNTEFICRAGSTNILAIRIELDPNPIKILIMPPKSDIIKLSIDGSKFNSQVLTQISLSSAIKTFYFIKTEQERFGIIYNLDPEEEINTRATELFAKLPNKEKMTDFVIFKCKKSIFTIKQHDSSKPIEIRGAVVVFYERFMNGRWQYATPEQWPDTIINFQLNKSM